MTILKSHNMSEIAPTATPACLNVGMCASKTNRTVRILDRNKVFEDIFVQGEEMAQFLQELKQMSDLPIGEAIAVAAAPYIARKWC